jgi:hypothetical protein
LDVDGTFQSRNVEDLGGGDTETYTFEFRKFERIGNGNLDNGVKQGYFFVIGIRFRDSATLDDRYVTYFIGPY